MTVAILVLLIASCELRKRSEVSDVHAALEGAAGGLEGGYTQVESEFYFGDEKEWAIIVVPDKPAERSVTTQASAPVVAELERTVRGLGPGQFLLAYTEGQSPDIRVLSSNKIRVDRRFVVAGRGLLTIVARIVPDAAGPPKLVSLELRERQ